MKLIRENPPPKGSPAGKPTRYQPAIDACYAKPGTWFRLEGEHHASTMMTLKGHGLTVRSSKGQGKHTHVLWVCRLPRTDPQPGTTTIKGEKKR